MKRYKLSFGQAIEYVHEAPDRTAQKSSASGLDGDVRFQVWPSRGAMARSIRMQQSRAPRSDDWRPLIPLTDGEGY